MPQSEHKSFNIVLMQIIGPLLIMAMVGSLVFFLIEVMYRGPHVARMYWVMFLFTGASVLVSRISIEEGRERAQLFGLALSVATLIACSRLVEFSYSGIPMLGMLVSASLIAVILWCTSKLTWDCTVVDRSRDTSAVGLVDRFRQQVTTEVDSDKKAPADRNDVFGRILKTITGTNKSNTPGLWVFYFAVFAFPVFGLGQWFVATSAKSWIFVLFAAYLGSALCLLAMTSLMSLNRYLATRKLEVPDKIARNWMIIGTSFAAFVVLLVMLLPRPASNGSIQNMFAWLQSPVRNTSKFAVGKDGNQNDKDARKQRVDENSDVPEVDGDKGKAEGKGKDGEQGNKKGERSKDSGKKGENDKGDGKGEAKNKNGEKRSKDSKKSDSKNETQKSKDNKQAQKQQKQQKQTADNSRKANRRKAENQRKQANQKRPENQQQNQNKTAQQRNSTTSKLMESLSKVTKWLVYAVGAVALLFVLWMLRDDLANLWALLMGKKKVKPDSKDEPAPVSKPDRPPPSFASFKNPFRNGKAKSMFGWQVAQYTMAALEAWGREYGVEREIEKTPQEFAYQLKAADPKVSKYARQFADVYGRIAFSEDKVSREEFEPLVKLWDQMSIAMQSNRNRAAAVAPTS